ncbi:MAG: hypothetical protein JST79_06540 [Acidobacteria bacterium]|nr:hypothetical protein [Acidobacteriota bacterium]
MALLRGESCRRVLLAGEVSIELVGLALQIDILFGIEHEGWAGYLFCDTVAEVEPKDLCNSLMRCSLAHDEVGLIDALLSAGGLLPSGHDLGIKFGSFFLIQGSQESSRFSGGKAANCVTPKSQIPSFATRALILFSKAAARGAR